MRAKGGRRKSKEISFCEDSVPRSAPQPANRGLNSEEAVAAMPSVPELSLMINGMPRPGVHLLQKPGSSGFIARAPSSTITPRLSARAIEKVPKSSNTVLPTAPPPPPRILPDDEGAVGGIITKEEADAMEFFRELNAQFEEKNRGATSDPPTQSIVFLDKGMRNVCGVGGCGAGISKKDKQRVRATIVSGASSPMPPPPRPTAIAQPPKAKPSVPELSVLANIPKPKTSAASPSAIVVSASGGRSLKKVNFEEFAAEQQQQQPPPPAPQQQQRPKPRKFSECERAMMKFQLESAERRILELEMELSRLQRKKDHTRERGIQAPVVRDKSTQVSPEILAPFKNTKKSKKRGTAGMENLKIIIPTPIPKEQSPKSDDQAASLPPPPPINSRTQQQQHDPSADAITQEKLLKALTQINSIFSAPRQHDPAAAAAIAAASAKVVASVSNNKTDSCGSAVADVEAAAAVAAAAARNMEARAARTPPATTATATATTSTTSTDDGNDAANSTAPTTAVATTPSFSANSPVFTTGNRTHAMAAQVVRAAFLKATTQRPIVPLAAADRSFVMKQLAAKYLPEWQNNLVVQAAAAKQQDQQQHTNGGGGPVASSSSAVNGSTAIDNLRNYNEFPFDSDADNDCDGLPLAADDDETPISPEEKDLLLAFRHRKILMANDAADGSN